MELQINQLWILKVHSMINSTGEYEPDLLNTFYATRVKKHNILQRMYELISDTRDLLYTGHHSLVLRSSQGFSSD